ncbi:hypothetical protein J2S74_001298 [Evansella vedderi]|uniref:Uncharacterized protein n=1 Tax=Evansella vedderi TaxID=38282 RepID=A0ABT9ZSH4_9BACI|nr:hypothetical protein [Evansella vedderi]MDQ0253925.1 hypothetical protein [Evansella vedderi]
MNIVQEHFIWIVSLITLAGLLFPEKFREFGAFLVKNWLGCGIGLIIVLLLIK